MSSSSPKVNDEGLVNSMSQMSMKQSNQESSSSNDAFQGQSNGHNRESSGENGTVVNSLTLRALVTSKEAGVIIGKGGANVAELREKSGVKAGVSKVIPGVHNRVLTITGHLEGVAKVSLSSIRVL